jgi:tetratricopeptide (TPR) repeat protein
MTPRDDALLIDKEHPWPWLDAFPESARAFFNGRDEAAQQLLRCVLAAPATVLFGKSGLGKTSLLQAGLSPLLREEQLLPVLVRLTHDSSYQPGRLSARLLARLDEEAAAHGLHCERPPLPEGTASTVPADAAAPPEANAASRLWEQLHDSEAQWLDAQGEEWTPVFILDQFEETFTLLHDAEAQQRLFSELGNLIQNRTPAEVAERRKAHDLLRRRLDPERLAARFVLSLREDYLPDLEIHADRIPRLGPNRYRLLPMSQADALQAIDTTGGSLVDSADAERIVQFLDQQNQQPADAGRPRAQRRERIEPALLSLVCAGLNQYRIDHKATKLDTRSLDQLGGQLLERFYDRALAALPDKRREAAARFVETELITLDGTRRPFPEVSLAKVGLTIDDIATLKDRRLLRTENAEYGTFVELVHDRVAAVALIRAQRSRDREVATKARQRRKLWIYLSLAIVSALSIGLIGTWHESKKSQRAQKHSESLAEKLKIALVEARDSLEELRKAKRAESTARSDAEDKSRAATIAESRASEYSVQLIDANRRLVALNKSLTAMNIQLEQSQKEIEKSNEKLAAALRVTREATATTLARTVESATPRAEQEIESASNDISITAIAAVSALLYNSAATLDAFKRDADDRLRNQRRQIEALTFQSQATGIQQQSDVTATRSKLAQAQERFVAALASRDLTYAREIASLRRAAEDIAVTPAGADALRKYNAGNEIDALREIRAELDARRVARKEKSDLETAADIRRIATLALDARDRGDVDTLAAIRYFEELTSLDPSNHRDWVELGRLYSDAGQLERAKFASDRAANTAKSDRDVLVAAQLRGEVFLAQGDLANARARFQDSLAIAQRLAVAEPSSANIQRDLSVSLSRLGDVLRAQGDLTGSSARFQDSLVIAQRLAAADPSSARLQRDASVSLNKLGDLLIAQGDLAGARARFQESLDILRRLAAADPSSASLQRDVSVSLNRLGDALIAQGDLAGAQKRFQESANIVRRLAAADPSSASLQRDVSVSLERLGDVLIAQGDLVGARALFQESLEIRNRLAAADPSSAGLHRDVSVSLEKLGDVLLAQGDLAGARARFQVSLEIRKRFAAADSNNVSAQRDVVVTLTKLAGIPSSGVKWKDAYSVMRILKERGSLSVGEEKTLATLKQLADAER